VDVVAPLIADREPAVFRKPGQRALDNPPVPPQSLARVDSASGDAWGYAPLSQGLSATREVVSLGYAWSFLGRFLGLPGRPRSRLIGSMLSTEPPPGLWSRGRLLSVSTTASGMPLRSETTQGASSASSASPLFPYPLDRGSGLLAPLLAGMEAESSEARSQSIWSASPRRLSKMRCRASPTPQPPAIPSGVSSKSSPIRSPSPSGASPRGCRS
jgi:hypothetical protein